MTLTQLIWLEVQIGVTNQQGMKCRKNNRILKSLQEIIKEVDIKEDRAQLLELVIEESYQLDLFNSRSIWVRLISLTLKSNLNLKYQHKRDTNQNYKLKSISYDPSIKTTDQNQIQKKVCKIQIQMIPKAPSEKTHPFTSSRLLLPLCHTT